MLKTRRFLALLLCAAMILAVLPALSVSAEVTEIYVSRAVTFDGKILVTADVENAPDDAMIMAVSYDEDGGMLETARIENGQAILKAEGAAEVKVLCWAGLNSLAPLCEAKATEVKTAEEIEVIVADTYLNQDYYNPKNRGITFIANRTYYADEYPDSYYLRGGIKKGDVIDAAFDEGKTDASSLLGYACRAYVGYDEVTGRDTIYEIIPHEGRNNVVTVRGDMFAADEANRMDHIYYWENGRDDPSPAMLTLAEDAKVYENCLQEYDSDLLCDSDHDRDLTLEYEDYFANGGRASFIDNDNDGEVEYVIAEVYTAEAVLESIAKNGSIWNFGSMNNGSIEDYDEADTYVLKRFIKNGRRIDASELSVGDTLTAEDCDNGVTIYYVSSVVIDGAAKEYDSVNDMVRINGEKYGVSPLSGLASSDIRNKEGRFYINADGLIAHCEANYSGGGSSSGSLKTISGTVTATYITALDSDVSELSEYEIVLDDDPENKTYEVSPKVMKTIDTYELIGQKVRAVYDDDDDMLTTLTINTPAGDIKTIYSGYVNDSSYYYTGADSDGRIEYCIDHENEEFRTLSLSGYTVIYNGKYVDDFRASDLGDPDSPYFFKNGKIELINNGSRRVAKISNYETYVVKGLNTDDDIIDLYYKTGSEGQLDFEPDGTGGEYFIFRRGIIDIEDITDLRKYDVLNVLKSPKSAKGTDVNITEVTRNSLTGRRVTGSGSSLDNGIELNNRLYRYNYEYVNYDPATGTDKKYDLRVGDEGISVYFDHIGQIAAVAVSGPSSFKYNSSFMIVTGVMYGEGDNEPNKISGYVCTGSTVGSSPRIYGIARTVSESDLDMIGPGDIVRFLTGTNGDIATIDLWFDASDPVQDKAASSLDDAISARTMVYKSGTVGDPEPEDDITARFRLAYGTVVNLETDDRYITVSPTLSDDNIDMETDDTVSGNSVIRHKYADNTAVFVRTRNGEGVSKTTMDQAIEDSRFETYADVEDGAARVITYTTGNTTSDKNGHNYLRFVYIIK
ncbi:MAG: hypothetical protein J1F63_03125 [Oscillospiraceae bacterium]|nr:hypothetical protein [Oscillospiraceae bacterium]